MMMIMMIMTTTTNDDDYDDDDNGGRGGGGDDDNDNEDEEEEDVQPVGASPNISLGYATFEHPIGFSQTFIHVSASAHATSSVKGEFRM